MFVAAVVNQKKRKRTTLAKDWPPTSAQKKTLLPYEKRFKLPRLDEAPYLDVWIKIIQFALVDCKDAYKMCCRKMKYFQTLHETLRYTIRPHARYSWRRRPLEIRESSGYYNIRVDECADVPFRVKLPLKLEWILIDATPKLEKLVWIDQNASVVHVNTQLCGNISADHIYRFLRVSDWERFVCDFLYRRLKRFVGDHNYIGSSSLKEMVRLAPKGLDRYTAKDRICELSAQNPRMDQAPSSEED